MADYDTGPVALIINMARATERMGFMAAQMSALGLAFERIEAVTPDTLTPPAQDPVWHRWQRPMRVTEMALCASHAAAWARVETLGRPCLVLEDDAVLAAHLPDFLKSVMDLDGVDHISLETRSRKKLVSRALHPAAPMRRMYQDRTGAAAYVVWPSGATKLLAEMRRAAAPADALISSTYAMASYQADPALSVQLDQCAAYGVPQAIPTTSQIDAVKKPPLGDQTPGERRAFRTRRILAQLHMGARHLRYAAVARRLYIAPAGPWAEVDPQRTSASGS
ncbi:MAG: glycosyltransferase family 25 protein [Roseicyclus sp.]|jgi:glycosyl transferase family 25